MTSLATKTADRKGRVTLGPELANLPVSVERVGEFEYLVKRVRVIPESEAWLYENPAALTAVRRGLQLARVGEFVAGPDLAAAAELAAQLEDVGDGLPTKLGRAGKQSVPATGSGRAGVAGRPGAEKNKGRKGGRAVQAGPKVRLATP